MNVALKALKLWLEKSINKRIEEIKKHSDYIKEDLEKSNISFRLKGDDSELMCHRR